MNKVVLFEFFIIAQVIIDNFSAEKISSACRIDLAVSIHVRLNKLMRDAYIVKLKQVYRLTL